MPNTPESILAAWTALEVLSPASFRRPKDLARGKNKQVVALGSGALPWGQRPQDLEPDKVCFWQVILGSIELEKAFSQLLRVFPEVREERPVAQGHALLAVVTLTQGGQLAAAPAVQVSSFAWGLPKALGGDLRELAAWPGVERALLKNLEESLRGTSSGEGQTHENEPPLDRETLAAAFAGLVEELGLPAELVKPPSFVLRSDQYQNNPNLPEPPLLNSFFLHDLATTRRLFRDGEAPANLRRYLAVEPPPRRLDLLSDPAALEQAVAPAALPPARWPAAHSLVLLQQAAVNLGLRELAAGGIFAVNGPPGTGKTTLLRDWVAALVTARAEAMARFDHPANAFRSSKQTLTVGSNQIKLFRLSPKLKGFEMVVASSNNKAVENVTTALPAVGALGPSAAGLRYFKTLSDALLETKTWGLAAAVLGNAANRARFTQHFWRESDVSLASYLAAASGSAQSGEFPVPGSRLKERRPPRIVSEENPPRDADEALERWQQARADFRAALKASRAALAGLEAARQRGERPGDPGFSSGEHGARQQSVPWLGEAEQQLRDQVFVAAINLHRAFLDAAAVELRSNLGAFIAVLGGRKLADPETKELLGDLWSSLFLVVPLISTTFASVGRMFGELPPESLGWLLIDEAGQAPPQAAVGALLRCRRALVVGDPAQIEPVVALPEALTQALCRAFDVDPKRFNAPQASAQTLADAASPVKATFEGPAGSREVGAPLLVHRRCNEPMFGISNELAYGGLMVQATAERGSAIGDLLGPSGWIDVAGRGEEKWCPEEGFVVGDLLRRLLIAGVAPDLYVLSPFVTVADRLRELVGNDPLLATWLGHGGEWARQRIGTVHTAQGREAEAVILVLGAPLAMQEGARLWAGRRPNLLNVAVSRAQERLYVVGNRALWRRSGLFAVLDQRLEAAAAPPSAQPSLDFGSSSRPVRR